MAVISLLVLFSCGTSAPAPTPRALPSPEVLQKHCREQVGDPQVQQLADNLWVARGYDLANTIVLHTPQGNLVVDAGMSPQRAQPVREAIQKVAPGPTAILVLTHSHIDHVGGASVWMDEGTQVWATDAFQEHFFKQYGTFFPAEGARGAKQFGQGVPLSQLPCSSLGRQVDLDAALTSGAVLPTHTFSGAHTLTLGDQRIDLIEAHGETHDQLLVSLPGLDALLPGDNWYSAFPNLYTLRGTRARHVDDWVESLDRMRALDPSLLVPSHTAPVQGKQAVRDALRDYRDGIAWLHTAVVRGANAGQDIDTILTTIALPPHLAAAPALLELYGQLDWSARAIYSNELGWFDGRPEQLYPLAGAEVAARTVQMMGGVDEVQAAAERAQAQNDTAWALHLLRLLEDAGHASPERNEAIAQVLEQQAQGIANTNGRGWLLQSAIERRGGGQALGDPVVSQDFMDGIPLAQIFQVLAVKLKAHEALEVHESVAFEFTDDPSRFVLTVRRGVAELVEGGPLPGTPEPVATVVTDAGTWRAIALKQITAPEALADGRLEVQGSLLAFVAFMGRFERDAG